MWARTIHWLLLASAALLAGCAARTSDYRAQPRPSGNNDTAAVARFAPGRQLDRSFNEALALTAELRYQEAAPKFLALVESLEADGQSSRAAEALFWAAYCYEKQGQQAQATEFYNRVIDEYPQAPASRQAADRLARLEAQPPPD